MKEETIRGRYKVIKEISRGGMGVVFLALDLLKDREVAIKKSFYSGDEKSRKGFEVEAKLLARLNHEGLPKVRDYFLLEDNSQALVMDFVRGETLQDILESGKMRVGRGLDPSRVLDWTIQILDILRYLHNFEPPIVHRDIKPNNIKLTREGKIVLLDFGLAKGTSETIVKGMSGYSPLEQIDHTGTDPRSDIYALGTTLFHLLTDDYPIKAIERFRAVFGKAFSSESKQINSILLQKDIQKSVRELNPEVSKMVSDIVMKAMALMAEDRFQSADEMLAEVIKAKRSLDYGISKAGAVTNVESFTTSEKRRALIKDDEENLSAWNEKKSDEKKSDKEISPDIPIKQPQNTDGLMTTVSSDIYFSGSLKSGNDSKNTFENLSATEKSDSENPSHPIRPFQTQTATETKINSKLLIIAAGIFLIFLTSLGFSAWYFLSNPNTPQPETVETKFISNPIPPKIEEKEEKTIQISKYGIGKNGKVFPLDEDYRLAEGEKFKFNVKTSTDGFLYIISHDNNGNVGLAYPNENQKDNDVKKDAEKYFPPNNTFEIFPNTPPLTKAYFVIVESKENELAQRIAKVLPKNGKEVKMASTEVAKLINDLEKLAQGQEKNETVQVKVQDIWKK